MSSLCAREQRDTETWPQAFQRRLEDGTAWTTGWTEEEIALPSEPDIDQLIAEAVFDSDGLYESGQYMLHRPFDDNEIEVWKWDGNIPHLVRTVIWR